MADLQFRLTGRRAGIALVILAAGFIAYAKLYGGPIDDAGRRAIVVWLASGYTRPLLPHAMTGDRAADSAFGAEVARRQQVTLRSVSVRGFGADKVVRVEPLVAGGVPPDNQPVRYLAMSNSLVVGWLVRQESNRVAWWLALFGV